MTLPGERILSLPAPPDFLICDPAYGRGLPTLDCLLAANNGMLGGDAIVTWSLGGQRFIRSDTSLPKTFVHGKCAVLIRFSYYRGSQLGPLTFRAAPERLRDLAAKVIQQCVTIRRGIGGFGTLGIANVLSHAAGGNTPWNQPSFPPSTAFITVSVARLGSIVPVPGDTDPSIARSLARVAPKASPSGESGVSPRSAPSSLWLAQSERMTRRGRVKWYEAIGRVSNEMIYQCDAKLGTPSIVDCTQIEWNQLTPPFDTLAVGPGATTFLHSNTCYLAISAAISLVLTWAQIRTAVSTLINVCVQAPLQAPLGGRAYSTTPQQISDGRKRRQSNDLTGLNALPPSTNITIYEQKEHWVNQTAEFSSCTWNAVSQGLGVSTCENL